VAHRNARPLWPEATGHDRAALDEVRREVELGANPFDHVSLGLASIDFLKQERVLAELERTSYDVIIVDESHHCVDLGALACAMIPCAAVSQRCSPAGAILCFC